MWMSPRDPTGPPATDVEYLLSDGTSGSWNPFDDGDLVIGASLDRDTTYTISFSDPGTAASPCDTIIVFVTQSCECPVSLAPTVPCCRVYRPLLQSLA